MPDMQTALTNVLNSWNQPQSKAKPVNTLQSTKHAHLIKFAPTNNVTRATFDYIHANPGTTAVDATKALVAQGFNAGSISSILSQLVAHGQIKREADRKLFTVVKEYVPLKRHIKMPRAKKVSKTSKQDAPQAVAPVPKQTDLLATMNIKDARALYDELKQIFGG